MSTSFCQTLDNGVQPATLSGLWETATGYGTPIARATTHDEVVHNVFVRMNYNEWIRQGKPTYKTVYYSSSLIGGIIWAYRSLVVDKKIGYYNPSNVQDTTLDLVRDVCCTTMPSREVAKKILDNLHWSAFGSDANVDPNFAQPPVDGELSQQARDQVQKMDQSAEQAKQTAEETDCGFMCQLGRPFKAMANLTEIMSFTIPILVLGVAGSIAYVFVAKGRQFDVNRAMVENQKTIRQIGPDTVAAIVRKGV